MKHLLLLASIVFVFAACHSRKKTIPESAVVQTPVKVDTVAAAPVEPFIQGEVVNMDSCGFVVKVSPTNTDPFWIIPRTLPAEYSVNGLKIQFHYRLLKMPMRAGCKQGRMAELSDISKI